MQEWLAENASISAKRGGTDQYWSASLDVTDYIGVRGTVQMVLAQDITRTNREPSDHGVENILRVTQLLEASNIYCCLIGISALIFSGTARVRDVCEENSLYKSAINEE